MNFDIERVGHLLSSFDFPRLFVEELGWDRHNATLNVSASGETFSLKAVAEKRGAVAWVCEPDGEGAIPQKTVRLLIDREVSKSAFEHIVVFVNAAKDSQVWVWPRRVPGRPIALVDHPWRAGRQNTNLIQRLRGLVFTLDEENDLQLPDVTTRLEASLNADRVTKRFYEQFAQEHRTFLSFIDGIENVADREWYASLMLNRLMFVYFMQRKGFLDGNIHYLREKLAACQEEKGHNKFYSFYRYFLLALFHKGLGSRERDKELEKLLGRIPYLNGGLFEKHVIEERSPDIQIPDDAFERIFTYFDRYQWHLDERPLRAENEINPDVLGYIFEKYINQKQMGAYYTKEDITGYITKNTVIPYLLDATKTECRVAFENFGGPTVWDHLRDDPDRYLYEAVKRGVGEPLPEHIEAGTADVSKRTQWNTAAPESHALSTEIWREVVARRERYASVRQKLTNGEVHEVNDLITFNLDIAQFAQDIVDRAEGPDLLRATWKAVERVTVLDPTCGSGAFLFAALNVLEPLYDACLNRMETFVSDTDRADGGGSKRFEDFRTILEKVSTHPNRRYFILKSIILNNLFGVDIMEEAVEICKLRLFLKLAAQVDPDNSHPNLGIEPLPDIDFNIRAGNTLIGYANYAAVHAALTEQLDLQDAAVRVARSAAKVQATADAFRAHQVNGDGTVPSGAKTELRSTLEGLRNELDLSLSRAYGVDSEESAVTAWVASHEPFHWFVEFYGIMQQGGFDVVIGNPPYVELRELTGYSPRGYNCQACGNLYALVLERCGQLTGPKGRQGYIVPVSSVSTDRYATLQAHLRSYDLFFSNYDDRPSRLFDGLEHIRLTIHLLGTRSKEPVLYSTRYHKWFASERASLFEMLSYSVSTADTLVPNSLPKFGHALEAHIGERLAKEATPLFGYLRRGGSGRVLYSRKVGYFLQVLDFIPTVLDGQGNLRPPSEFKDLFFANPRLASLVLACLNSNLFYWFITVASDCRHLNKREIEAFPIRIDELSGYEHADVLIELVKSLMRDLRANSEMRAMRFRHDTLQIQFLYPVKSKALIDQLDQHVGTYLGLTPQEIDFLVNYDAKYRSGAAGETDDEADE
jgi:hypothetical protein